MRFHLKRRVGQLRVDVRWRCLTKNEWEGTAGRRDRRIRQIRKLQARLDTLADANRRHKTRYMAEKDRAKLAEARVAELEAAIRVAVESFRGYDLQAAADLEGVLEEDA